MYLLDSNILIYSYSSAHIYLRELVLNDDAYTSEISRLEVLGYSKLTPEEETYFRDIFDIVKSLTPASSDFNTAINIRKTYNLKLADSLIAATALENGLTLYTRNLKDFEKIKGLKCIDPVIITL